MKRFLVFAVLLTALGVSEAFASGNASATASVTLSVSTSVTLTKTHDLNLGTNIPAGTVDSVAYNTADAAAFTLSGTASTPIIVTWTGTDMTNGSTTLTPTYYLYGNSTNVTTGLNPLSQSANLTSSTTGAYYFWGAAAVSVPSNANAGSYSGSLTVSIAY